MAAKEKVTAQERNEFLERWACALESGQYTQGKYALCRHEPDGPHYCCLGVADCILGVEFPFLPDRRGNNFDEGYFMLRTYLLDADREELANLNDERELSFPEIAVHVRILKTTPDKG